MTDELEHSPWYVRAFIQVGMPTAFAAVLLWFLMTIVTGAQNKQINTQIKILENQTKIVQLVSEVASDRRIMQSILLAMCYNASTTNEARERCGDAMRVK